MNQSLRLLAALGLASVATLASADGDPAAGQIKFETCRGCHAVPSYTNAFPQYPVPMIGGQHATRIVAALQAYRAGDRKHPTMIAQASSLTDQDMQDIAAYLAADRTMGPAQPIGESPAKAVVCAACHGSDGNSPSPEFAILAGQYSGYLERALNDYQSAARSNPIMSAQAASLTPVEIRDLARWFAAQSGPLHTVR